LPVRTRQNGSVRSFISIFSENWQNFCPIFGGGSAFLDLYDHANCLTRLFASHICLMLCGTHCDQIFNCEVLKLIEIMQQKMRKCQKFIIFQLHERSGATSIQNYQGTHNTTIFTNFLDQQRPSWQKQKQWIKTENILLELYNSNTTDKHPYFTGNQNFLIKIKDQ
jgi:hypothetical protein